MANRKKNITNQLSERVARNDDIFCSLLFDNNNKSIRVIDFRGGNFQAKHAYLERALLTEGMRKIFTLIERDDMTGWQRMGYLREGTIPGYYKRSDAYIMSRIYDDDWDDQTPTNDLQKRKDYLTDIQVMAEEFSKSKATGLRTVHVSEEEIPQYLKTEWERRQEKLKKSKKTRTAKKQPTPTFQEVPIFNQFSREVEYHYSMCQNKRTKQMNLFGSEYQDCFGNAKLNVFFTPKTKAECMQVRYGLLSFIDWLVNIGAISMFAMVPADDIELNAIYASIDFKNSGWLNRQLMTADGPTDLILWTKKLII